MDNTEGQNVILPYTPDREYWVEELSCVPTKPVYSFLKRCFDILVSVIVLIILAIPMLVIALIVKLGSPGPALFAQDRLGKNGKPFKMMKFRSMYVDAEKNGAQWSAGDQDSRITRVGRVLRNWRLDELPQFMNVLSGSMSIVGPRPERACFYDEFETYIHGFRQRTMVKPGITGLAQVRGGYDLRPEDKIVFDMEYIQKRSALLDIRIMLNTVRVMITHEGAK